MHGFLRLEIVEIKSLSATVRAIAKKSPEARPEEAFLCSPASHTGVRLSPWSAPSQFFYSKSAKSSMSKKSPGNKPGE
ncbi:hypothetical protein B4135_2322 [Caldibacillus debilis]|uniref:Uncharacterized protein n=1 Tax=Caldibacillus debilis TaxID=301148 RepID=A0A150M221_9BACI|nr:hypothetical protein B4135_2322 [Caldibacillus debilis]